MESNYSAIIEEMTNMIIRPHRDTYLTDKLGPTHLIIKTKTHSDQNPSHSHKYIEVARKDFAIQHKSQKIQVSYFSQVETVENLQKTQQARLKYNFSQSTKKCVIYLHANSGSRIQGLQLVKFVLSHGYNMAIFDYRGSGISGGQYTSMGVNEAQDLQKVMQYLNTYQHVGQYSLWGRSMGAVTILYYLTKQYFSNCRNGVIINSIVLDSPFSNMRKLMYQIGATNVGLPQFVFMPLINSITEKLVGKMGFNLIAELDLVARMKEITQKYTQWSRLIAKINCLFLTSTQDKLVNHVHVETLHRQFPFTHKQLHFFNGQHNQVRSDSLKLKCAEFLCQKTSKSVNEIEKNKMGSTPYFKMGMRRSEISLKNSNNSVLEVNTRQGQFLGKNIQKTDQYSPRSNKIPVNFRKEEQKQRTASRGQVNNPSNSFKQQIGEQGKSTIIINNNYNVNVNVYGKGPIQILPDIIPPLNFKQQGGSMTDRLCDNHNFNFKFYTPYSAKVQRKSTEQPSFSNVSNASNMSNISTSSKNNSSLYSTSYMDPQTPIQKQARFHSATIETHPMMFQPSPHHHLKDWNRPKQTQSTILPSKQQSIQQKQIEIPLIKFDQVDANNQKLYSISSKIHKNMHNQLKACNNSPKAEDCFLTKKDPQNAQKQKLSLSQLRKIQKQVQQKSDIKSSKIIYINKQRPQIQQELLKYKKQDAFLQPQSCKYKSEEYDAEQQRTRQSKDMKCMKTSLMAKRKKYDRKSTDHITLNTLKHSVLKKEDPIIQQRMSTFIKQKQGTVSQKRLLYKFKIDRL